jgi:hypothetical protein
LHASDNHVETAVATEAVADASSGYRSQTVGGAACQPERQCKKSYNSVALLMHPDIFVEIEELPK